MEVLVSRDTCARSLAARIPSGSLLPAVVWKAEASNGPLCEFWGSDARTCIGVGIGIDICIGVGIADLGVGIGVEGNCTGEGGGSVVDGGGGSGGEGTLGWLYCDWLVALL